MSESKQVCPFCERAPGERHRPSCARSQKKMRLRALWPKHYLYPLGTRQRIGEAWAEVFSRRKGV